MCNYSFQTFTGLLYIINTDEFAHRNLHRGTKILFKKLIFNKNYLYLVVMQTMNGFQTISIIGVGFSIFCQLLLLLVGKNVEDMWALYPTWAAVFMLGTVIRLLDKGEDQDHH
jgi:hypothetical protein